MSDAPSSLLSVLEEFLKTYALSGGGSLAVGVSGGPDSMALAHALCQWSFSQNSQFDIHILHVNHGLRPESDKEAALLEERVAVWPNAHFVHLRWEHDGVPSKIQEEARHARYALMTEYCHEHQIKALFLAHHMGDQAETVLFRLAKGSGLDGLSGMMPVSQNGGIDILRPCLEISKNDLISYCVQNSLEYFEDPSNRNDQFLRVRLRQSMDILQEEGLTHERLSVVAKRMLRARKALDSMVDIALEDLTLLRNTKHFVLDFKKIVCAPEEIALRCIMKVMETLDPADGYGPRMEKVESLFDDLIRAEKFRKRTLGGIVFERDDEAMQIKLSLEEK